MRALLAILEVVLRVLLPVLFERSRPTAEDGAAQPELRDRLRLRIRKTWGLGKLACLCLAVILLLPGCGTRTVYVPSGEPVRLRETVRRAKVWIMDADGKPVAGVMDLPEGWYCLPADVDEGRRADRHGGAAGCGMGYSPGGIRPPGRRRRGGEGPAASIWPRSVSNACPHDSDGGQHAADEQTSEPCEMSRSYGREQGNHRQCADTKGQPLGSAEERFR